MLARKERGEIGSVVVAGCLAERKKDELLLEVPGVDRIVGVFGREEITQVVGQASRLPVKVEKGRLQACPTDEQRSLFRPAPVKAQEDTARLRITPRHYAYLKISEGCDRLCTFCAIPGMRGKHVTKPIEEVLREARELAADGVRELILVAQDTTYYGLDLYGKVRLAELLRELDRIDGIDWIRIMYAYPIHFTDELIETLARGRKILPYLDLPLQHINDRILKRMQRRVRRQETEELLTKLRSTIPNLVLRTTFIAGFPGETEAEFAELIEFIGRAKFERAGVFPYSFEPGTPATKLDGHLPEEIKQERRDRLMRAQQQVALAWTASRVGHTVEAIVDAADPDVPNHVLARSQADAPEIDCLVRVKGKGLLPGDLVHVKVTGGDGYDLLGRAVGKAR
jgi:ribosomal protein S12 methylthiotransferase